MDLGQGKQKQTKNDQSVGDTFFANLKGFVYNWMAQQNGNN